jgi:serine/threonine protein kinase
VNALAAEILDATGSADHLDPLLLQLTEELQERAPEPAPPPKHMGPRGRFELLKPIGAGAMGSVFEAYDTRLDRHVAIKWAQNGASGARQLETEARALARLDHEHVMRLFDIGECDGAPFLVLERLEGQTLSTRLAAGPLALAEAMEIARALVRGLVHVHERGVVHRDLKPSNVFLTDRRTLKIIDFGLAFCGTSSPAALQQATAANDGSVAGSPAYMAPEQWRGEQQDERTDIWAVGILMYQLFLGDLPFDADTLSGLREQICSDVIVPEWRAANERVPARLLAILEVCLAKQPQARFASAQELRRVLDEVASS